MAIRILLATTVNLRQLCYFMLFLASIFLAGCQTKIDQILSTPEQRVLRTIPKTAQRVQLLTKRKTPTGNVGIVYSYRIQDMDYPSRNSYRLCYSEVEWNDDIGQWDIIYSVLGGTPLYTDIAFPIDYHVYQDTYTAIYGPIQSNKIKVVAVTFANGETVREEITEKGFLLFSLQRVDVCELRFYDAGDQLIEEKILSREYTESDKCSKTP